jgi:hypothetical protein
LLTISILNSAIEIQNQTVKDLHSPSGTRQYPTIVINLTKIGSTLSPEEHRLHAWSQSAYRGIQNIRESRDSSMKICRLFLLPALSTIER